MQGIAKAVQCCSLSAVPYHLDLSIIICQQLSQRISYHSFTHLVGFFYKNFHFHCQCHIWKENGRRNLLSTIFNNVEGLLYFSTIFNGFVFVLVCLHVCLCWSCQVSPSLWTICQKGHMSLGILYATCYQQTNFKASI